MSWVGSNRAIVYLGVDSAGVVLPRGADGEMVHWLPAESASAACERATQHLLERTSRTFRKWTLDIQLSGALARPFLFQAVDGLRSWKEASKVAATLAPEATGLIGPCAVWLDDWRPGQRCVAVSLELAQREQIEQIVRDAGLRLTELRPWWTGAIDLTRTLTEGHAKLLVARDPDSLTVLTCDGDAGYLAVATYAPRPAPLQARALVTRAAMAANVAAEEVVSVGLGESPAFEAECHVPRRPLTSLKPTVDAWA